MKRSRRVLSDEESFLIERYGKNYYSSSRWKIPAALVALIGIPWLFWSAGFHSSPSIREELIAFKVIDERSIEITYLVERNAKDLSMECILVARDFDKNVVGEEWNPALQRSQGIPIRATSAAGIFQRDEE